MDNVTLECFVAAAESRSFTKAAERMFRTQSAVSQQIIKLERKLGKQLFRRGTNLSLTEAGEVMLHYARKIIRLQREVESHFNEIDIEGEIRFGLPEDFASVLLSEVLIDFARTHSSVVLNVETDLTLHLLKRFKEGEFDLVLVKLPGPEDFPRGVEVWSEGLRWVGNRHLQQRLDRETSVPLVLSPAPCVYRNSAIRALDEASLKWRIVFSSPSYSGTTAAVTAKLGITVLPQSMIPAHLEIIEHPSLPKLEDTHVSLLKQPTDFPAVSSLEEFVIARLKT